MTVGIVTGDVFAVFCNPLTPGAPAFQARGPYRSVRLRGQGLWGYGGPVGTDADRIATRPIGSPTSWELDNGAGREWADVAFLSPLPGTTAREIEAALTQGAICMSGSEVSPADIVPPGLTPEAWGVIRAYLRIEVAQQVGSHTLGFLSRQMEVMQSCVSDGIKSGIDSLAQAVKDKIDEQHGEGEEWKKGARGDEEDAD